MKLKDLLNTKKVVATGFSALAGLGVHSKGDEDVVLSSLSPAILADQGITEYYAIELPRNTVFKTTDDIINANPPVRKYKIEIVDKLDYLSYANPIDTVIASRHQGTVEILQKPDLWQWAKVFKSVTAEDIKGKHVVGTLPPHLIKECDMYTAVTIKDFDYNKDGDLTGQELEDRLLIANNPIKVREVVNVDKYVQEKKRKEAKARYNFNHILLKMDTLQSAFYGCFGEEDGDEDNGCEVFEVGEGVIYEVVVYFKLDVTNASKLIVQNHYTDASTSNDAKIYLNVLPTRKDFVNWCKDSQKFEDWLKKAGKEEGLRIECL